MILLVFLVSISSFEVVNSIVRHHVLIEIVKATNEAIMLYKPPSYHAIRKRLLDNTWYNTQKLVEFKQNHSFTNMDAIFVQTDGRMLRSGLWWTSCKFFRWVMCSLVPLTQLIAQRMLTMSLPESKIYCRIGSKKRHSNALWQCAGHGKCG